MTYLETFDNIKHKRYNVFKFSNNPSTSSLKAGILMHDNQPIVISHHVTAAKAVEIIFDIGYVLVLTPPKGRVEGLSEFTLTYQGLPQAHYANKSITNLRITERFLAELLEAALCDYLQWKCRHVGILYSKIVAAPLSDIATELHASDNKSRNRELVFA